MRDTSMFDILSTLDDVENNKKTQKTLAESVNNDTAIKANPESTMRSFLEMMEPTDISRRLDESAVKPEGPKKTAMKGTHVMAKGTKDGQHPAHEFLVGGEEGEVPEGEEKLDENENSMYTDLMRDLEQLSYTYGENAQNEDWFNYLQDVIGNYGGNVYGEYNASDLDSDGNLPEAAEMGGSDDERRKRAVDKMKRDSKAYKKSQISSKGDNLKLGNEWDMNLDEAEDTGWGDEMVEALKLIVQQMQPEEMGPAIEDLIQQYEQTPEPSDRDGEAEWDANMERESIGEARGRLQGDDRENDDWEPDGEKVTPDSHPNLYNFGNDDEDHLDDDEVGNQLETYDPSRGQFVKQTASPYKAVNEEEVDEDVMSAKQSFADVFKSMDESEEESTARLEKELFTELDEPAELKKNEENGKYELNDDLNEDELEEGWNSERDAFKRQEQNAGLEDEEYTWNQQPWAVCFNGKPWKTFQGKQAAQNISRSMAKKGKTGITIKPA